MKKRALFLVLVFALSSLPALAQKSRNAAIKRIDAYVKTLNALVKDQSPHLIFADTSEYEENSPPKWQKFATEKELEKFRETRETYTVAYNWRQRDRLVISNFTLFSPSGDWTHYVFHYFRADGTLAKIESDYRTFVGDFIVLENVYFNKNGAILQKNIEYKDLTTQKPKKPSKDYLRDNLPLISKADYYKKTSRLPFSGLLKK